MSQENSLRRKGCLEQYNQVVQEYIDRGVWTEVSQEEIKAWEKKGQPVHFLAHHAVIKEESKSTKCRIVLDSTMKNNYQGPSLNDVLKKGPNGLASLYNVFIRWRSYEIGLVFDLSKAYNHCSHAILITSPAVARARR